MHSFAGVASPGAWISVRRITPAHSGLPAVGLLTGRVFLGPARIEHDHVVEAPPLALLAIPADRAGILVVSLLPKLLIEPISATTDSHFCIDPGVGWYVAGNDLRLLESAADHGDRHYPSRDVFVAFWLVQRGGRIKSVGARATAQSDTAAAL